MSNEPTPARPDEDNHGYPANVVLHTMECRKYTASRKFLFRECSCDYEARRAENQKRATK